MKRNLLLLAAAAGGLLALGGGASAATLTRSPTGISYDAAAGEANQVRVERSGNNYVFTEPAVTIAAGAGCVSTGATSATCPVTDIRSITFNLGNGNDTGIVGDTVDHLPSISMYGGPGTDTLIGGTNTNDSLMGEADADTINARGGSDQLSGGDGNDLLNGGGGNDYMAGGFGNDTMNGGDDHDQFEGGEIANGADTIDGGAGSDSISFYSRVAPLSLTVDGVANDGQANENDNIIAVESVGGGRSNDTIALGADGGYASGGSGDDVLTGGSGEDNLAGEEGDDTIAGGDGDDSLNGGPGRDTVDAGAGNDRVEAGYGPAGPDVYRGGPGSDLISYVDADAPVAISLDGVANDGIPGANDNVGADFDDILGTRFADTLSGNAAANEIDGGDGNDTISALGGSDEILAGRGDDTIDAGAGVDAVSTGTGADRIRSRDGSADDVACGGDVDSVIADAGDTLRACESASLGAAVRSATARARARSVTLAVSCPAAEAGGCRGTLTLTASRLLGRAPILIPAGATRQVRVPLTAAGRRVLAARPATRVIATLRTSDTAVSRTITVRR